MMSNGSFRYRVLTRVWRSGVSTLLSGEIVAWTDMNKFNLMSVTLWQAELIEFPSSVGKQSFGTR